MVIIVRTNLPHPFLRGGGGPGRSPSHVFSSFTSCTVDDTGCDETGVPTGKYEWSLASTNTPTPWIGYSWINIFISCTVTDYINGFRGKDKWSLSFTVTPTSSIGHDWLFFDYFPYRVLEGYQKVRRHRTDSSGYFSHDYRRTVPKCIFGTV